LHRNLSARRAYFADRVTSALRTVRGTAALLTVCVSVLRVADRQDALGVLGGLAPDTPRLLPVDNAAILLLVEDTQTLFFVHGMALDVEALRTVLRQVQMPGTDKVTNLASAMGDCAMGATVPAGPGGWQVWVVAKRSTLSTPYESLCAAPVLVLTAVGDDDAGDDDTDDDDEGQGVIAVRRDSRGRMLVSEHSRRIQAADAAKEMLTAGRVILQKNGGPG
jgi:hypothetical protein